MNPPPKFTPEQLLEHGRSLRALARGLLGDEGAAEDVVQDALVMALERPPATQDRIGGWLNTVVRTLALKRLRGERRRTHREEHAAQPEQTGSTIDSVTSAALCKQLVDAVLELDEPYRTVISMRYFDDLPPREIAARLGVPRNTVRAQLQRGLAQLRERFDADSEGGREAWAPALLMFAGLENGRVVAPVATVSAGSTIGVLAMAGIGKWVAAAIVIVALSVGLIESNEDVSEPLVADVEEPEVEARSPAQLATGQTTLGDGKREGLETVSAAESARFAVTSSPAWQRDERFPFEVRGLVVDSWGRGISGAQVYLAVDAQRFNQDASTDRDGRFTLLFEANSASVDLHLYIRRSSSRVSGMRTLRLASGVLRKLQIDLRPVIPVIGAFALGKDYIGPLANAPRYFRVPGDRLRFVSQSGREIRDGSEPVVTDDEFVEDHSEAMFKEISDLASFVGTLLAADGEPAGHAMVFVQREGDKYCSSAVTGADGEWEIDALEPGNYTLNAGGDDYGLAAAERVLTGGEVQRWDSKLDRGDEVRGRLVGPNDELLEYLVRAEPAEPGVVWSDSTRADKEGRFAFPNAPRCAVRILVFDPVRGAWGAPLHVEDGHSADGRERTVKISEDSLQSASISLSLTNSTGEPVQGAEVRLYHPESERGAFVPPTDATDEPGRYSLLGLSPGSYRIEASSPPLGWIDLGSIGLQAGADLDLGDLSFPEPGRMLARCSPRDFQNVDDWVIYHEGQHVDSLAWDEFEDFVVVDGEVTFDEGKPDRESLQVQLPAGDYSLRTTGESMGDAWFPFHVESGGVTELKLPFALLTNVSLQFEAGESASSEQPLELTITDAATGTRVHSEVLTTPETRREMQFLPGAYRVELTTHKRVLAHAQFEVKPAVPQVITLLEPSPGSLSNTRK